MTATWSVNTAQFLDNAKNVVSNNSIMAVVKNNAYHYDLEFSVKQFLKAGINTFSTTSLKEAIRVRKLTDDATIFLMNPTFEFDLLRKYRIQMTLPSLDFYYYNKKELAGVSVHLEFENLLHRSGLHNYSEILEVLEDHANNDQSHKMNIVGLWTHFGYADEFDVPEYETEKRDWLEIVDALLNQGYTFDYIHAQNSASYYREDGVFPHHTHARIGIALYGSRPYSQLSPALIKQSLTVSGKVIQVRDLKQGDYCGYSFTYEVKENTKLAVVDIGYGDGILKARAKGQEAIINGKRYPIRGLMMSHMFVEVDDTVHAEDDVILYNNDIRIDEFTFKGVGANSEQLSAMNHDSLIKEYV
ncbi:alanine racemase [Staphylococcus massiliensis]|uniref:Alanine racemase n=1 Tax=Staphylococcus massiliensis S46 TaxID=1229783 RepID=K9AIJ2_9STAP|nr:alanine racemase [Staphylococcus massiliensis]EKU47114.1 alanine racemase [Staphylococcus massiliensis S46]